MALAEKKQYKEQNNTLISERRYDMFNSGMAPSLSDIAAVTKNGDNGGWGNGEGWWVLIILLALFGWGGYGNGNNAGTNGGTGSEIQRGFDTSAITTKLDALSNGICSLGYDQLSQMNGIQNSINQASVTNMQNANALSAAITNCCCENRQGQADIKYAMASDTCAITNAINQASQNIMQNDNANYRQLHDENVQIQMENYKTQIANLQQQLNNCDRDRSNNEQSAYLLSQLKMPQPVPAWQVPNPNYPWGPFGINQNFNSGCC